MSDTLTFAEIDGQHVELLPNRTVLSSYCGYHCWYDYYYCGSDFDYNEQTATADANQTVINIGEGTVVAGNEAHAVNEG